MFFAVVTDENMLYCCAVVVAFWFFFTSPFRDIYFVVISVYIMHFLYGLYILELFVLIFSLQMFSFMLLIVIFSFILYFFKLDTCRALELKHQKMKSSRKRNVTTLSYNSSCLAVQVSCSLWQGRCYKKLSLNKVKLSVYSCWYQWIFQTLNYT